MKTFTILMPLLLAAVVAGLVLVPGLARAIGERVNDLLFGLMARTGAVLGMAEITSRQAARIASSAFGYKMGPASSNGVRASVITGPDTAAWAQNDTCGNRDRIPAGSRIIGAFVSCAAMGASVTLDVGLRAWTPDGTGAAVDADGIVTALAVSSATSAFNGSGALVAAGVESVTTVDTEPYFTLGGANPTDDADIRVTVLYIAP